MLTKRRWEMGLFLPVTWNVTGGNIGLLWQLGLLFYCEFPLLHPQIQCVGHVILLEAIIFFIGTSEYAAGRLVISG